MKVHFETMSHDAPLHLETVEMGSVPRVGEHVRMRGDKYGGSRPNGDTLTLFEVVDVYYDVSDGKGSPTVFLRLDEQDEQAAVFRPRCDCEEGRRLIDEDDRNRCDNCGGIAWWRSK